MAGSTASDEELLRASGTNDPGAFGQLQARYSDRLFRYALARLGERAEAQDAVQDTLVAAWQAAGSYRGDAKVSTWLLGICRHKVADLLRRRKEPTEGLAAACGHPAAAPGPEGTAFWHAMRGLPEEQQDLILMVFHYGLSQEEVAQVLDIPVGTAKSRTHHARRALQARLTEEGRA